MRLTVHQSLAMQHPLGAKALEDLDKGNIDSRHVCVRWVDTERQVGIVFVTVALPKRAPFWSVSMNVTHRENGPIEMRKTDKALRSTLRAIGEEMLRGVGEPESDAWRISERSLHLHRRVTQEELEGVLGPDGKAS
jgi:hypothetical protein